MTASDILAHTVEVPKNSGNRESSMSPNDPSTYVEKFIEVSRIVREVLENQSSDSSSQELERICSYIRSCIKESKPRTDEFRIYLKLISSLSYLSPSVELRTAASQLMNEFRHIFHIHEGLTPSRFEGDCFLGKPDFSRIGSLDSRVSHLQWVLSSQGEFLELYYKTTDSVMRGDGPLPRPYRHYIAMLGAAAYGCEYLVRHEAEDFLLSGGDPDWLLNPSECVPKKLKCLSSLSEVMAHRPWALDSSYIEQVVVAGRISTAELVHAIIILATYHSLPSLVFGAGIRIEDDLTLPTESCTCTTAVSDPFIESEPQWDETAALPRCFSLNDSAPSLLQRLLQVANRSVSSAGDEPGGIAAFEGFGALNETTGSGVASPVSPQPRARTAPAKMGEEEKNELAAIMASQPQWKCLLISSMEKVLTKSEYRDFSQKSDSILHTMSFSWEDHAMVVLSRQMAEAAEFIHEEYVHSLEFTTGSIGDHKIESTTTVREAILKYVQRMYGVFHDDYKYDQLNKILPVIHKAYLKKLACYPDRLTKVDYLRMRKFEGFTSIDLIHYAHLVAQTKRVVELTWAMKALMSYQSHH
jgi:sestrin